MPNCLPFMLVAEFLYAIELGRCNRDFISLQNTMELIIAEIHDTSRFRDPQGTFADFKTWNGVHWDSAHSKVQKIDWSWSSMEGSINLQCIPEGVECVSVGHNMLTGSISLHMLPYAMLYLSVRNNALTGSVNLTALPKGLQTLYLCVNQLSGNVDLTRLSATMQSLDVSNNIFSGSIDLSKIPPSMFLLDISANSFEGVVPVPRTLEKILHSSGNSKLQVSFL
ncbi:hypothetical protein XU18_1879 [Perkinsela sp. CCAP 1560/4]|nr:hypothetical protein XU18_1879 [Perkinsela sp. CCAP 1560/4]|eukprot:KNH07347.1 hypothetical protein XU18_1879 [Perkinsela sp. CCAP 1560/4]